MELVEKTARQVDMVEAVEKERPGGDIDFVGKIHFRRKIHV